MGQEWDVVSSKAYDDVLMVASILERGMVMRDRLSAGVSDSQYSCKKASMRWMCRCVGRVRRE